MMFPQKILVSEVRDKPTGEEVEVLVLKSGVSEDSSWHCFRSEPEQLKESAFHALPNQKQQE